MASEAPQSRQELEANLAEYKSQKEQVEQLLLMGGGADQEMQEMYDSLTEVIQLTEELLRDAVEAEAAASSGPAAASAAPPSKPEAAPASGPGPSSATSAQPAAGPSVSSLLPAAVAEQIRKAQIRAALQGKAPVTWLVGAPLQALYAADGQYYDAKVVSVAENGKVLVTYDGYVEKEELPLGSLREKPEAPELYRGVAAPKRRRVEEAPVVTEVPKWLEIKEGDDAKTVDRKRKLIKSFRSKMRFAQMDLAAKEKAESWKNFVSGKGSKKKTGFMTGTRKESIFAVPEGFNAKVGVTGSGKGMTQYKKVPRPGAGPAPPVQEADG